MSKTDPAWYAFRDAVGAGDFALASEQLRNDATLVRAVNSIGETVLHHLAVENDLRGVTWLHERGSDVNTKNEFGTPVLFEVAQLEYKELFVWLVAHGADRHATNAFGQVLHEHLIEYEKREMAAWVLRQTP